jgi:hypothetical protein
MARRTQGDQLVQIEVGAPPGGHRVIRHDEQMNRLLLRQSQSVLRVAGLEDDIPEGDQRVPGECPDISFVIDHQ